MGDFYLKDYLVFDLETPNLTNTSISSVALLLVRNNKIVESISQLINPETYFDDYNIRLTHIKPDDVKDCPSFDEYWPEIKSYFTDNIIVGHNVTFDLLVLSKVLDYYGLDIPEFDYCCTLRLSRKNFDLHSYRLPDVSAHLNFKYNPHIAIEDASASYNILEYLNSKKEVSPDEYGHYHYRLRFEKSYEDELATNINNLYGMIYILRFYDEITPCQVKLLKCWHDENECFNDYTVFNNLNNQLTSLLSKRVITSRDIAFLLARTPCITTSEVYSTETLLINVLKGIVQVILSDDMVGLDELNILYDWLLDNTTLKGDYIYDNLLRRTTDCLKKDCVGCDDEDKLFELFDIILKS